MPRTAAVMLGLALAALSIGFNTVQYPAVWEMTRPIPANESAQTAVASSLEKPESPAPAQPPQPAPSPIAQQEKEVEREKGTTPICRIAPEGASRKSDLSPSPTVGPEMRKPLVPVTQVMSPTASERGADLAASVRRLPPVDRTKPNRPNQESPVAAKGSIPVYPTTGIP